MIPMYEFKPESVELLEMLATCIKCTYYYSVAIDLQEC